MQAVSAMSGDPSVSEVEHEQGLLRIAMVFAPQTMNGFSADWSSYQPLNVFAQSGHDFCKEMVTRHGQHLLLTGADVEPQRIEDVGYQTGYSHSDWFWHGVVEHTKNKCLA